MFHIIIEQKRSKVANYLQIQLKYYPQKCKICLRFPKFQIFQKFFYDIKSAHCKKTMSLWDKSHKNISKLLKNSEKGQNIQCHKNIE